MFSDILMFDKSLVSLQVKRIVIISNKHGIYELPNNLKLRKLGNIKKTWKLDRIVAMCSIVLPKLKFVNTNKKLLKNRNWTFPVGCYFTEKLVCPSYFGQDCLRKQYFPFTCHQAPLNFGCFTILVTLRTLIQF